MININKLELTAKEQNILNILDCIIDMGDTSTVDIAKQTGLSMSTISRVINILKTKGLIVNHGKEVTELGRRPEILCFNKDYGQIIYMNISKNVIIGYLANMGGKILDKNVYLFEEEITLDLFLKALGKVYNDLIKSRKSNRDSILALGISVPGVVDPQTSTIHRIPNIYSFNEINLVQHIHSILEIPTIISNNARLSAIGQKFECYNTVDNLVCIDFSYYGIGAGVVINGKVVHGFNNAAGEIGEMFFDRQNFNNTNDSNIGCMEAYSGLKAMFDRLENLMSCGKAIILKELMEKLNVKELNLDIVEESIRQQDYDVQELFDDIAKVWAMGIINIFALLDPQLIILGGILNDRNILTLNKIKHFVGKALNREPNIQLNSIGDKAQIAGGTFALKQFVFNNIIAHKAIK